ncbi:hypothetical protein ANANG_G00198330 [Anguilla anguilla]|uniref:Pyridoxal phosphate phosphatase n=1 Tax=Anguilla anguilla TaxID=7936 RepID=A0A9D3M2E9_ANGAN|nr:hypothetical protein ANANG_G00198330 [Anguilla anguilla]
MAGAVRSHGCLRLLGTHLKDLLYTKHCVLFDCDGVIWNGEKAVVGAPEVVSLLKKRGKSVFFVTNNCTRPRDGYLQKFSRLGFSDVVQSDILSSAYCSAVYLRDVAKVQGKVYVIGGDGVYTELHEAGVPAVGREPEIPGATIYDCPLDSDVKAVLVGYDDKLNFLKLAKACCYLRDPDCLFLATDRDPWHPLPRGRVSPGSGSLAAALETAAGRRATVVGKPGRFMFDCIAGRFGVDPARTVMVGDRLETDILFGRTCGVDTVLTLTGVSTLEQAQGYRDSPASEEAACVPDYVVDTVADFLPALDEER